MQNVRGSSYSRNSQSFCGICGVQSSSSREHQQHLQSKKHKNQIWANRLANLNTTTQTEDSPPPCGTTLSVTTALDNNNTNNNDENNHVGKTLEDFPSILDLPSELIVRIVSFLGPQSLFHIFYTNNRVVISYNKIAVLCKSLRDLFSCGCQRSSLSSSCSWFWKELCNANLDPSQRSLLVQLFQSLHRSRNNNHNNNNNKTMKRTNALTNIAGINGVETRNSVCWKRMYILFVARYFAHNAYSVKRFKISQLQSDSPFGLIKNKLFLSVSMRNLSRTLDLRTMTKLVPALRSNDNETQYTFIGCSPGLSHCYYTYQGARGHLFLLVTDDRGNHLFHQQVTSGAQDMGCVTQVWEGEEGGCPSLLVLETKHKYTQEKTLVVLERRPETQICQVKLSMTFDHCVVSWRTNTLFVLRNSDRELTRISVSANNNLSSRSISGIGDMIQLSSNGEKLICVNKRGTIALVTADTLRVLLSFAPPEPYLKIPNRDCVWTCMHTQGQYLLLGSSDGELAAFHIARREIVARAQVHSGTIERILVDGNQIVTVCNWDPVSLSTVDELKIHYFPLDQDYSSGDAEAAETTTESASSDNNNRAVESNSPPPVSFTLLNDLSRCVFGVTFVSINKPLHQLVVVTWHGEVRTISFGGQ